MGLSLSLNELPRRAPAECIWQKYDGTKVWRNRWVLYNDHGQRIFTLLSVPKSTLIKGNAALLEVENEWLYHGLGIDGVLRLLGNVCTFRINGMSRCDMAADFCPDAAQKDIIMGLRDGRYRVSGKQNGSDFWSVNNQEWVPDMWKGIRIPHQQSWGHKTSAIKWKLYYKSKELHDAVGGKGFDKPYIVDMWREYGMDIENVWRLEVSVQGCNQHLVCGEPFSYRLFRKNMNGVFDALLRSRFDVRREEGHKDKSNDEQVPLLRMINYGTSFKNYRRDTMAKRNGRITLLRYLVQSIDTPEVLLDDDTREMVFYHIGDLLRRDGLQNYFSVMVGQDYEAWVEEVRVRAYDGMYSDGHGLNMSGDVHDVAQMPNTAFDGRIEEHVETPVDLSALDKTWGKEDTLFGIQRAQVKSRMKGKPVKELKGEFKR